MSTASTQSGCSGILKRPTAATQLILPLAFVVTSEVLNCKPRTLSSAVLNKPQNMSDRANAFNQQSQAYNPTTENAPGMVFALYAIKHLTLLGKNILELTFLLLLFFFFFVFP